MIKLKTQGNGWDQLRDSTLWSIYGWDRLVDHKDQMKMMTFT